MIKKVIRLKLTCQECHNVGYVELSKKDLKKLRELLTKAPKTRLGDWTRINYHENPKRPLVGSESALGEAASSREKI